MDKANLKSERILWLYTRLLDGALIKKDETAREFQVDTRTIQRDIDTLRDFFSNRSILDGNIANVIYDRKKKGFRLEYGRKINLANAELFTVVKILLESRSLAKPEMTFIVKQLISACVPPEQRKQMEELVANEQFHYIEPRHGKNLVEIIWQLGGAVYEHRFLQMRYRRVDGVISEKIVKPVGVMCADYYFYLVGFEGEYDKKYAGYPTIYRVDRIESSKILKEQFYIPYRNRFEEGEFRKRVVFMYGGQLEKVEFVYNGPDINGVLDKLPASEYVRLEDGSYKVKAEVYGKIGFEMWKRSQGSYILASV